MDPRARARSAAFTLIELLVVLVIVGVLSGIVLSVLGSAQESGKSSKCVSNQRQIFSALISYVQDHANRLPERRYPGTDSQGQVIGYPEVILGYIDANGTPQSSTTAKKLFTCPSQTNPNYPSEPGLGTNWFYDNVNLALVSQPAQTILLTDTKGQLGYGSRRADRDNTSGDVGRLDETRHQGRANYLFCDGHVSSLVYADTRKILSNSTDNPPPDLWGTDHGDHTEPAPTPPYGGG